jgi:hypothetical protein
VNPKGLTDKLYWREQQGTWHCFKKHQCGGFVSLCDGLTRSLSGGQAARRPEPVLRCGRCDGEEMKRRGWEESGPVTEAQIGRAP